MTAGGEDAGGIRGRAEDAWLENEAGIWLPSGEESLFAVHHRPDPPRPGRLGVLLCPPLAEEKNKARRRLVELARLVCSRGCDVLHPDYLGTGDSTGCFEGTGIATRKRDIFAGMEYLRQQGAARIVLLGLRLGGTLAAEVAESAPELFGLGLIFPVVDGREYLRSILRRTLLIEMYAAGRVSGRLSELMARSATETLDVEGFRFTPAFCVQLGELALLQRPRRYRGQVLLLHSPAVPRSRVELEKLGQRYLEAGAEATLAAVRSEPFWHLHESVRCHEISAAILRWLDELPASGGRPPDPAPGEAAPAGRLRIDVAGGNEQQVSIPVAGGRLSAMVHTPSGWQPGVGTAIVLIHGWGGYRIGPHRMFVNAARRLGALGYLCLRIDLRGRGSSSGNYEDICEATVQEDAQAAIDAVRRRHQPRNLVLLGQCLGASSSFWVKGIDGRIMWSAPPLAHHARAEVTRLWWVLRTYARKGLDYRTYQRLLTGRVDLAAIRRIVWAAVRALVLRERLLARPPGSRPRGADDGGRTACLMVFAERDPDTELSRPIYVKVCAELGRPLEIHIVKHANHSFSSVEWEREVIERTEDWLHRRFPGPRISSIPREG